MKKQKKRKRRRRGRRRRGRGRRGTRGRGGRRGRRRGRGRRGRGGRGRRGGGRRRRRRRRRRRTRPSCKFTYLTTADLARAARPHARTKRNDFPVGAQSTHPPNLRSILIDGIFLGNPGSEQARREPKVWRSQIEHRHVKQSNR